MQCLNISNKQVKAAVDEAAAALGSEDAAYYVISENNGYGLDYTPDGVQSILFQSLLDLYDGNRELALQAKARAYSKQFRNWFGDWEKGLTIKQDNKSYYRGQYDEPIIDKDGNLILKGKKDSLYERAGYNIEKGVSATTDMKSADEYGINQRYAYEADIEDKYGELDQSWEKEQELNEVAEHGYYLIQFSKNISNKIINEAGEVKIIDDVVIPKGQYTIEHITDESIEILATSNNNASKVVDENGEPTVDAVTEYDLEKPIYEERKENNIEVKSATVFQPVNMLSLKLATLFPHINVLYNQDTNKIDINSLEDVTIFLTDDREADADAHEYAHYYLHMFKDHPLVMAAIKLYGSMESLTKAVGEQATEQNGDAYKLFKTIREMVKSVFDKNKGLKHAMRIGMTQLFLQNKQLLSHSKVLKNFVQGNYNYTVAKTVEQAQNALQQLSNQIIFNEDGHTYTTLDGKVLTSVSDYKKYLHITDYDDSAEDATAKEYGDFTRNSGTTIHAVLEDLWNGTYREANYTTPLYKDGNLVRPALSKKALDKLVALHKLISDNFDLVASEAMLADVEVGVAGTTDLVLRDKKTGKFAIFDYKTKCIEIDGKNTKKNGRKLWGFKFVNQAFNPGGRTQTNSFDFQLTVYQKLLAKLGINTEKRGIIPITFKFNSKNGQIIEVSLPAKIGSDEIKLSNNFFNIKKSSNIEDIVNTGVFNEKSEKYNDKYVKDRASDLKAIMDKIISSLKNSNAIDKKAGRKSRAYSSSRLIENIGNMSEIEGMIAYIKQACEQMSYASEHIKKTYDEEAKKDSEAVWSLKTLTNYKNLALSYNIVDDIKSYSLRFKDSFTNEQINDLNKAIVELQNLQTELKAVYKEAGIRIYMEAVTPFINNIEADYRIKFEREYKSNHPGKPDLQEMNKYIQSKIDEIREQIDQETQEWLKRQREVADAAFECTGIGASLGTVFQSKDPFVQASVKMFDSAMQDVDHTKMKYQRMLLEALRKFQKKYGVTNFSKLKEVYSDFIEEVYDEEGNLQGYYLVSEKPNSYKQAEYKKRKEINEDSSLTALQKEQALNKWYEENSPITDKEQYDEEWHNGVFRILEEKSDKKKNEIIKEFEKDRTFKSTLYYLIKSKKISSEQADDIQELKDDLNEEFSSPDFNKFPNKKYQKLKQLEKTDDPKWELYQVLVTLDRLGNEHVAQRLQLNGRLPGIRKSLMERGLENGVNDAVVNFAKENTHMMEDDDMQGQTFTDHNNNEIKQIPLFYNGKLNKLQDQSFDLPTIYMRWFASALEHKAKVRMLDFLMVTEDILKQRQTKTGKKSLLSFITGREEEATAKKDNTYNQFAKWMDQVVFGRKIKADGKILGMSYQKLLKMALKYNSIRVMGFNYISMINNFTVAELNQIVESTANDWIDFKSYKQATDMYFKHTANGSMIADIGKIAPDDFINQLSDWFGIFSDGENNMRTPEGVQRWFTTDAAFWTTQIGEHAAQSRFLLATLFKLKAVDKNGNELGSMIHYLSFDEYGQLKIDEKVANFSDSRSKQFGMGVRSVLMGMHGNYNDRYAAALQQTMLGKMVLAFRKWIYTSTMRRYQKRYFDNIRNQWVEGYYEAANRLKNPLFLNRAYRMWYSAMNKQFDEIKLQTFKFNELTEDEKKNLRRAAMELSIIVISLALYTTIGGMVDGDDDKEELSYLFYSNLEYQLYRAFTDFTFYMIPSSFTTILQDPLPTMSLIDDLQKLLKSTLDPFDTFKSGRHKGDNKLLYRSGQFVPIYRQFDRIFRAEDDLKFLTGDLR